MAVVSNSGFASTRLLTTGEYFRNLNCFVIKRGPLSVVLACWTLVASSFGLPPPLEVLVVLALASAAAPDESVPDEEAVARIALFYLIGEGAGTVAVGQALGRFGDSPPRGQPFAVRVVERVDVDSHAERVFRQVARVRHTAEVEG